MQANHTFTCPSCGKSFTPCTPGYRQTYCSRSCVNRARRQDFASRFWKYVEVRDGHECWPWLGKSRDSDGRGRIGLPGKYGRKIKASHAMIFVTTGEWPTQLVLHTCDNPACVNPAHLFEGTVQDNADDRVSRDRQSRGSAHGRSKLTESQVLEIRRMCAEGMSQSAVGKAFGVSQAMVSRIVLRKKWTHI